ncbi:MAG: hypothetical protein A4E66_00032 [Syntrophus sp. PtaB.Bin001]|nr:MAG: hypothetical protein A4E66_00032 [Syntrophus sp. PtaB.Bin001]
MKLSNLPECFETDLVLRWLTDGHWEVAEPFIINSKHVGRIVVPAGTRTDGPSIPKIPIVYEKYRDRAWPAAVPHDFGYDDDCPYDFPREAWDEMFHELMDALYPGWIDHIQNDKEWLGVRLGGASHFRKDD